MKKEDLKEEKTDLFIPEKLILLFKKLKWYSFLIHHTIQNVLAHIYPHVKILFPRVNNTAKIFASNLIPIKWLNEFTIRQPIQIYSNSEDFYLKDVSDYECLKEDLLAFFEQYTMPLLEDLTCEKDYLTLYENKDKRIIWDNNQCLYVASAYFNEHRLKEANQVIEKRFGKKGLRKQYKEVFDFFENIEY